MEQNLPIVAKKVCKILQAMFFMLRKGISKAKLWADLSLLLKRGKIAGKAAMHNLMSNHHGGGGGGRRHGDRHISFPAYTREYEFSCSNSPAYGTFNLKKRKHSQQPAEEDLMAAAMEMIVNSAAASPAPALAMPGFGASPLVRQLRVTDSPFPLLDVEENRYVDEAAEEFIAKFYNDLRRQKYLGYDHS